MFVPWYMSYFRRGAGGWPEISKLDGEGINYNIPETKLQNCITRAQQAQASLLDQYATLNELYYYRHLYIEVTYIKK